MASLEKRLTRLEIQLASPRFCDTGKRLPDDF